MKRTFILLFFCALGGIIAYFSYEHFFPQEKECCVGKKIHIIEVKDSLCIEPKNKKTNNN